MTEVAALLRPGNGERLLSLVGGLVDFIASLDEEAAAAERAAAGHA